MGKALCTVALLLFVSAQVSPAQEVEREQRTIKNENAGVITLTVPKAWAAVERHHFNFGTTFYRLMPPDNPFQLEILFNDLKHMSMSALTSQDLERYIESNMARAAPQSIEGKATAVRFGPASDGVYARLTDKSPGPGEPIFLTQGVRLLGNNVVLFTLYDNDNAGNILASVLEVVASVKFGI